jgi:hypothetical protein
MAMQGYGTYPMDPNLPPEIAAEQQRIAHQQRIAEAMLQRGLTPLPPQAAPYHWTQGLGQIFNAYSGRRGMEEAQRGTAALGQRYQQGLADEVQRIAAMRRGAPATSEQIIDEQAAGGEGAPATITAPSTADPRGAIEAALLSQYAPVRQMGAMQHGTFEREQTREADRMARLQERLLVLEAAAQNASLAREERAARAAEAADLRRELQANQQRFAMQLRASQPQPITAVTLQDPNDPNATIVIDARTERVLGKGPKLSETGKVNVKRQIASQGVGDAITRARELLTGKGGEELPTQSGIGAAVDYAASIFGATPKGAKTADKLKVAGGSLVSKVPRFEGPQSDKDTAYYKEVAGRIGDPTMPIERRLAALDEVENIWGQFEAGKKYGFFAPTGPSGQAAPAGTAPPGVRVVDW